MKNDVDLESISPVIGPSRDLGHFTDRSAFETFASAYRAASAALPPADVRTIETSAGRVRCYRFTATTRETARQAPLVLVSGRNAATPMWGPSLDALRGLGRPVYAIDSIGEAGCSVQTAALTTVDSQARWIAEVLRAEELDRAHLVGHSLGGWLAVQVALRHSDLVGSVTALDPPATFTRLSTRFALAGLAASSAALPRSVRRRLLGRIAGAPIDPSDPLAELGWVALQTFRVR